MVPVDTVKWSIVGFLLLVAIVSPATATEATPSGFREMTFQWIPPGAPRNAYKMDQVEDQHRIFVHPGVKKGGKYPVLVGFHGQPKRGKNPRDYTFFQSIRASLAEILKTGVKPFILVTPVFRFHGQNWPGFDPGRFREFVSKELEQLAIEAGSWYAFGHSGAAGCGGDGLNLAHRLRPEKVGFFDTCLGIGWQKEIGVLRKKGIATVHIHSVETAGFRPRQRPEYQADFDFGRAFGPVGLKPTACEGPHPGKKLRDQPFRCAITPDGGVRGFVVDTGEGVAAHEALLRVAFRYFLLEEMGLRP